MINVILHRVLVLRDKPEDTEAVKTQKKLEAQGLVMPRSYQEEVEKQAQREAVSMDKGVVIAIGDTAFKDYGIESPIKVGDYITYAKFGGKDVIDPETEELFVVINDADVVAILTKKEG